MKNSKWLYSDKDLNGVLTKEQVEKAQQSKVVYFWDGNNGDKHLVVGHTTDGKGNIATVLAINLHQSYLSGTYGGYSNANKACEALRVPKNGSELVYMFNNVRVFNWR